MFIDYYDAKWRHQTTIIIFVSWQQIIFSGIHCFRGLTFHSTLYILGLHFNIAFLVHQGFLYLRLDKDHTIQWMQYEISTMTLLALCEFILWPQPSPTSQPTKTHPPPPPHPQRPVTRSFDLFDPQTVEQTIETPVIWDAFVITRTSP